MAMASFNLRIEGSKDHGLVDSPYMIGSLGSLDQGGQFFSETF